MLAERHGNGQSYHAGPLTHGGEVRALGQRQTNHQPDHDEHGADKKWYAPSPRQELLVGQLRDGIERQGCGRGAGRGAHLWEARRSPSASWDACSTAIRVAPPTRHRRRNPAPAAAASAVLGRPRRSAHRWVADPSKRSRCPSRVGNTPTSACAQTVPEVPEHHAAEREEPDAKCGERQQHPDASDVLGKNSFGNTRDSGSVDEEVVELDGRTDEAGHRNPLWRRSTRRVCRGFRGGHSADVRASRWLAAAWLP